MRAIYAFDRSLGAGPARSSLLARAADAGIDTLITKAATVSDELAEECARTGLRILGSVACFSDHAEPAGRRRPDLRPIGDDGRPWQPMEWYTGLVPTDRPYVDQLVERCAELAAGPLRGLMLDFIRWPLHWELELRAGVAPRQASFDATTLRRFQDWSGVRLPPAPTEAARVLLHELRTQWTAFRCAMITDVVQRIARRVRPAQWLGAFVVPAANDADRRDLVGQALADWTGHLDGVLPMTYHAILGRSPATVADISTDVSATFGGPTIPMIQSTADAVVARGFDWGPPVSVEDFAAALRHAGAAGDGLCIFPAEGMDEPRWRLVAQHTADHQTREASQ